MNNLTNLKKSNKLTKFLCELNEPTTSMTLLYTSTTLITIHASLKLTHLQVYINTKSK